jgi:hypothetical protein
LPAAAKAYGFISDEEEVLKHLALALAAIGDRSAVEELKIAY